MLHLFSTEQVARGAEVPLRHDGWRLVPEKMRSALEKLDSACCTYSCWRAARQVRHRAVVLEGKAWRARCTRNTVASPGTDSTLNLSLRASASIALFSAITKPSIVS
jgi:hypothetical protein